MPPKTPKSIPKSDKKGILEKKRLCQTKKVYLETDAEDQESERKVLTQKEATVKKSKTEVSSEEDQEEKQK